MAKIIIIFPSPSIPETLKPPNPPRFTVPQGKTLPIITATDAMIMYKRFFSI